MYLFPYIFIKNKYIESIESPEGFPEPLKEVFCPRCNILVDTEFSIIKHNWTLCFCIPLNTRPAIPFLRCKSCKFDFSTVIISRCQSCNAKFPFSYNFCAKCGKKNGSYFE